MTGNLAMLAPAMIAVGLATVLVGNKTIYTSQLANRSESPAHRFRFATPLMASISVTEATRTPRVVLGPDDRAGEALDAVERAHAPGAPVVRGDELLGVATLAALREAPTDLPVVDLADPSWPVVDERDGLDEALEAITERRLAWLPVLRGERFVGILGARDLIAIYKRARASNVRRLRDLADETVVVECLVSAGSTMAGSPISKVAWPKQSVVVAVHRDDDLLVPRGDLVLREGDRVAVLAAAGEADEVRTFLAEGAGEQAHHETAADSLPAS